MGRYLGIDYGSKRIGVAISDDSGIIAFPLSVIENMAERKAIGEISGIVREKTIERIVVGMPLSMDGSKGIAADNVERFIEALKLQIAVPVEIWDERLSTRIADRAMIDGGLSRRRRRQSIDKATAQIILQSYLDSHSSRVDGEG